VLPLFIGLWGLADRKGRLEDRPKRIKIEIFPYRDLPLFNGYLTELQRLGFIDRYEVDGLPIIQVINFTKHQSPHKTEKDSILPSKPVNKDVTQDAPLDNGAITVKAASDNALTPDSCLLTPDSCLLTPEEDLSADESALVTCKQVPIKKIIDLYHKKLPSLPEMKKATTTRTGYIRQRWREGDLPDLETWGKYFDHIGKSDFLMGRVEPMPGRQIFRADLEWITKPANYAKIFEGRYHGEV